MISPVKISMLCAAIALLAACKDDVASTVIPGPVAMTEEAVGHYCSMNILEHEGPKAQIHLEGFPHPIWFSQVRDGIAFTRSPEEHFKAVAVYVNDMGRASRWEFPGDDTWINADTAWFVIGSAKTGGMGAPEAIPFGDEADALAFTRVHGGTVMRLSDVPDSYVLGPVDLIGQLGDQDRRSAIQ